jgi:ABC-type oligopeptide transport system ATPase subunit
VDVSQALLEVKGLNVRFAQPGGGTLQAVEALDFTLARGEKLGVVGESGCGKSTLARAVTRLGPLTSGDVYFDGTLLSALRGRALRRMRRKIQLVFQDARAALDPRMRAATAIEQPLIALYPDLDASRRRQRVLDMMARVGLSADLAELG